MHIPGLTSNKIFLLCMFVASCTLFHICDAQEIASMDGGCLAAGSAAVEKFTSLVVIDREKGGVPGFLSDVANYEVRVNSDSDSYTFIFIPKPYHGNRIKGGGAAIVVEKKNYKVIDWKYFK
jgi:hypothetical protein